LFQYAITMERGSEILRLSTRGQQMVPHNIFIPESCNNVHDLGRFDPDGEVEMHQSNEVKHLDL
jgi:hypothetical protein